LLDLVNVFEQVMLLTSMTHQRRFVSKFLFTKCAWIRFLLRVGFQVCVQVALLGKAFVTVWTGVGSFASVDPLVGDQVTLLRKPFLTDFAGIRSLDCLWIVMILAEGGGVVVVERSLVHWRQLTSHESAATSTPLVWRSVIA
jgi:hypothetical protein